MGLALATYTNSQGQNFEWLRESDESIEERVEHLIDAQNQGFIEHLDVVEIEVVRDLLQE